jgi:hypothetical protein
MDAEEIRGALKALGDTTYQQEGGEKNKKKSTRLNKQLQTLQLQSLLYHAVHKPGV